MIAHHDELSLLDKAGSQLDKGRAWRHELQLALSTPIACRRMNKLTSCHNISEWISGDLDSKCIALICQHCSERANDPNNVMRTQLDTPSSLSFAGRTFCSIINITFQSHKNNWWMPPQQWAPAIGRGNGVRFCPAFILQSTIPVFNVSTVQKEGV